MAVRTKELGHFSLTVQNQWETIYTVPAGKTAIVKELSHMGPAAQTIHWRVSRAGTTFLIGSGVTAANVALVTPRLLVLEPADVLQAMKQSGSAGLIDVWVSGAELDGVAT